MKTISNNRRKFPRPFKFAMYLLVVTIVGLANWVMTYANEPERPSALSIESRLVEALVPIPEPEPELEEWILSLEDRLAEALEPVSDLEPELEEWILNFSEDFLKENSR
jgi:hypothetical protein